MQKDQQEDNQCKGCLEHGFFDQFDTGGILHTNSIIDNASGFHLLMLRFNEITVNTGI